MPWVILFLQLPNWSKCESPISFNGLLFISHSNHHWKIAIRYLMFAALGSVHDKEQNKLIKITVRCTVLVFSLTVMPTCHALRSLPSPLSFLKLMCYSPLFSPPACAALGSLGTRRMRTRWSKSSWGTPRWSGGWNTGWLWEWGLFSLAKKRLTRRNLSAVFNSLCLPAIPKLCFLFILMAVHEWKINKVPRIPGSYTPCDLHFAIACLAPKTVELSFRNRVLGFLIVDTCRSFGLFECPCIFLNC